MLGLKPIKLLPARERVASALRKAIIGRQIEEGEVLTLENTAQELGVSVTPVREAFQILARDGLIELKQNKGAVVLGVNEKTLREHYQIRAALEAEACRLCCTQDADLSGIENVLTAIERFVKKGDYDNYSNLNQSFHMEIWMAAGNEKMKNMLSELWNGLSTGRQTTEAEYARRSMKEHQEILRLLKEKDAEGAYKAMHRHIERSLEDMLTEYAE